MKKILGLLLALVTSASIWAETRATIGGVRYILEGKNATVTYLGNYYYSSDKYYGYVHIPEQITYNIVQYKVTSVGNSAFYESTSLDEVELPNSITSIGSNAFYRCTNLQSIVIPENVSNIGSNAFQSSGLLTITCLNPTPPSTNGDIMDGVSRTDITLYVPYKSLEAYHSSQWGKEFPNIQPIDEREACQPARGDGSELQPYEITRFCELLWYKRQVDKGKNTYAILDADISLGDSVWYPIGSKQYPFRGHFDGRNHYISNFTMEGLQYVGIFGYAEGATIENIKVRDAKVTGVQYTGIICGYAANTNIIACDNFAEVNGQSYTGGICGYLDDARISNCLNAGEVVAIGDYSGGVAGYLNAATVDACKNEKSVSSTGQYTGGIAGTVRGDSKISNCSSAAKATVTGTKYVGGLCGNVTSGTITSSSNSGAVYSTNQETGGLIGTFDNATATNLTNYGHVVSTSTQVGGVIGSSKNTSYVTYCANAGTVSATNDQNVGGLIGNAHSTSITACVNTGTVQGKDYTGGLVGYHYESSTLKKSINYGPVSGADRVGGVTGESRAPMEQCFSVGHVSGTGTYVGGITGNLFQDDYAVFCLYDIQLCPLENAFGAGAGDGEGVPTANLTGSVADLDLTDWTMEANLYPRPVNLATKDFAVAGASAIFFADNDDADHFANDATLSTTSRSKWSSKGGTQINGTTAKPAIVGPDTLYVTKTNAVKAVPVNVKASTLPSYTLTIKAGEHGRVDNEGGKFAEGTEVTVTAIPDDKYQFAKWNDGNKNNPRTFVVTKDETYTAQFEKIPLPKYQVTVTAGQGGTVNNVSGEYEEDTELTLTATPNAGWRFVRWSDGNTDNPRTLVVTEAVTLSAEFEEIPPQQFTIAISAGEGGSVNSSEINGTYNEGTELTLIATPADNDHFFIKWSDGNTDNPRTLVLTSDTTLRAEFGAIPYYLLTISAGPGGTVNDTVNQSYREGSEVIIEAKPNEDYVFIKWSDGVDLSRRTIVITSDTVLCAEFAAIEYFDLVVKADEGGTVNDTVNGRYRTGDKVYIEAKPKDDDHRFTGWSDSVKTNPRTITITADSTIIAHFEAIPYYTLTVIAGEGGTVDESVNKSYREGIEVTIKATPDEDHTFLQWSDGNTDNPRTITMTEDKTLEAQFSEIVRLEVWIGTAVGGTVNTDAGGRYEEGTTITLQATPDRGYVFDHWSDGSKANPYNYTVPATDVVIYPVFYQTNCVQ